MGWTTFLEAAPAADHAVQIYDDVAELAHSVGRFLEAGFQRNEPAIVIATGEHWQVFEAELAGRGLQADELRRQGLLVSLDAEQTLAALMDGELPSPARFEDVVARAVDEVAARNPDRTIRAFGEMVDLLWRQGQEQAAIALEELWNELADTRRFALLCAYELDIFDIGVQTSALPEIFRAHSHPRPAADTSRLAAAVDKSLVEVLGPFEAGEVYLQVAEQLPRTGLPRAQAVLQWLSGQGTPASRRVVERVRTHYVALRQAATSAR